MNIPTAIRKPFRYEYWNATLVIVGVNLVVYMLTALFPEVSRYLAMNPQFVLKGGMFWQPFTYQFVHGGLWHLLSNMIGLLFFGLATERRLGSKEFVLLYFLSATLCGILSLAIYVLSGAWYVFLIGASGAVFAIVLAYAVLFPGATVYIWGILPIPAPLLVIGYAAIEVFNAVTGSNRGVAHATHLIGFAVCWCYFLVRFGINPAKVWSRGR